MPTADYSLDDVTAAVLSIGGPGLTTETDLVKKKILVSYIQWSDSYSLKY